MDRGNANFITMLNDSLGNNTRPVFKLLIFWVISFVFILICCWPTIGTDYAHHDDCRFWCYDRRHITEHPDFWVSPAVGRPLYGLLHGGAGLLIETVTDLRDIRIMSLFVVSLCAALYGYWLSTRKLSNVEGLLAGVTTFLLPGFLMMIAWVVAAPMIVGVLLAIISGLLCDKISSATMKQWRRPKNLVLGLASFLFLLCALFTYQPSAMFFVMFVTANVLFSAERSRHDLLVKVLGMLSVFAIACVLYFVINKWVLLPYWAEQSSQAKWVISNLASHEFNVSDPTTKFRLLITRASIPALNLWYVGFSKTLAFLVISIVLCGMAIAFGRLVMLKGRSEGKTEIVTACLRWLMVIVGLWLLVNAMVLLPKAIHFERRVLFPYSAFILLLLIWALRQFAMLMRPETGRLFVMVSLATIVLLGGLAAQHHLLRLVVNDAIELAYVRAGVVPVITDERGQFKRVHGICSEGGHTFMGDKSGPPGTKPDLVSATGPGLIDDFIRFAMLSLRREVGCIEITHGGKQEPTDYSPDTIVVDLTRLQRYRKQATPPADTNGGTPVFWPLFWERIGFPQQLHISRDKDALTSGDETVRSYSLRTGHHGSDSTERMPKDWLLEGSNDGANWTIMDRRRDETGWKNGEQRSYSVADPGAYKYYRLNFVAGNHPTIVRLYGWRLRSEGSGL